MAIKGKKKSQKKPRPTGARRPAAAAPRSAASGGRPVPFYRTFEGQLAIIIVALTFIGVAMFETAADNEAAAGDAARATQLRAYTTEVQTLFEDVGQTVQEMGGAPFNLDDPSLIEGLDGTAEGWVLTLEAAGAQANALMPPEELAPANRVLANSLQLYSAAAKTYQLVPRAEGRLQQRLLDRGADQRTRAGETLLVAIQLIDAERDEVGLAPSELQSPSLLPPIVPTPSPRPAGDNQGDG